MTSVDRPVMQKKDYKTDQEVRWCPGCGDYSILNAVQGAFAKLGKQLHETVIISGIRLPAPSRWLYRHRE